MDIHHDVVFNLNFLCKTYDSMNKALTSTKNRLHALNPEALAKHQDVVGRLESEKGRIGRRILKECEFWPVYTDWMQHVPGAGPYVCGNMILLYYYRFQPICTKCEGGTLNIVKGEGMVCDSCGKTVKDGLLKHRVEEKDFPRISNFWSYMGVGINGDGKKPKKAKGSACNWSSKGRAILWQFGEGSIKLPHSLYREYYDKVRRKRDRTHPDASKMHKLNMARHETGKLFAAHFWLIARGLDGKEVTAPYADTIMGHTVHKPYYFKEPECQ